MENLIKLLSLFGDFFSFIQVHRKFYSAFKSIFSPSFTAPDLSHVRILSSVQVVAVAFHEH